MFVYVRWQVTLRDPVWQVMLRSFELGLVIHKRDNIYLCNLSCHCYWWHHTALNNDNFNCLGIVGVVYRCIVWCCRCAQCFQPFPDGVFYEVSIFVILSAAVATNCLLVVKML